jgi:integrase
MGQGISEVRDRALVLLAFTSALRRSELAALDLADLEPDPAGLVVRVRPVQDRPGRRGRLRGDPPLWPAQLCAVRALQAWITRLAGAPRC